MSIQHEARTMAMTISFSRAQIRLRRVSIVEAPSITSLIISPNEVIMVGLIVCHVLCILPSWVLLIKSMISSSVRPLPSGVSVARIPALMNMFCSTTSMML